MTAEEIREQIEMLIEEQSGNAYGSEEYDEVEHELQYLYGKLYALTLKDSKKSS